MAIDHEGEAKKDIEKYLRTGKLPADYDTSARSVNKRSSPYWEWVTKNTAGREPLYNSGEVPMEEPLPSTNYGAEFRRWIETEFPKLSDDDKELFLLLWERGLSAEAVGKVMGLNVRAVYRRSKALRNQIARWVGLRM